MQHDRPSRHSRHTRMEWVAPKRVRIWARACAVAGLGTWLALGCSFADKPPRDPAGESPSGSADVVASAGGMSGSAAGASGAGGTAPALTGGSLAAGGAGGSSSTPGQGGQGGQAGQGGTTGQGGAGLSGAGGAAAKPCASDSACQLVSDYCTGCDCRALGAGESLPAVPGPRRALSGRSLFEQEGGLPERALCRDRFRPEGARQQTGLRPVLGQEMRRSLPPLPT